MFNMLKRSLIFLFFLSSVYAANVNINYIRVCGLNRVSVSTVLYYAHIKNNQVIDTTKDMDLILHRLYKSGLFSNLKLSISSHTLLIKVKERVIIAKIDTSQLHHLNSDALSHYLTSLNFVVGAYFDRYLAKKVLNILKGQYNNLGYYAVKIKLDIHQAPNSYVKLKFLVDYGPVAHISKIIISGNHNIKSTRLINLFRLGSTGIFSWWTHNDLFNPVQLKNDLTHLNDYYHHLGYHNFSIDNVYIRISTNMKHIAINIHITEGAIYHIGGINLTGVPHKNFTKLHKGDIDDWYTLQDDLQKLKDKYKAKGYLFIKSVLKSSVDYNKLVFYKIVVKPGKIAYVNRINIKGNTRTSDIVVRREMRQLEASVYDQKLIHLSKLRISNLGDFSSVSISYKPSASKHADDLVDLDVLVKESDTGRINLTLGYVQGQGISLSGMISQANFLGSGYAVSLNASVGKINNSVQLSFLYPYLFANGTALLNSMSYNRYSPYKLFDGGNSYETGIFSFTSQLLVPVSEFDRIAFGIGFDNIGITLHSTSGNIPSRFTHFIELYGDNVNTLPLSIGWQRRTTNKLIWPTSGAVFNQLFTASIPGVGPGYYQFTSDNTWYIDLYKNIVLKIVANLGFINSYDNDMTTPFYKNYFIGGVSSLRGYSINSIGPVDSDKTPMGGSRELLLRNDIVFPIPFINSSHFRGSIFLDAGNVWDTFRTFNALRASTGVSLNWLSPIGLIAVSYAFPFNYDIHDNLQPFQVQVGGTF